MKEIEITVKVFDSVEKTKDILARQGLKIIDTYSTKDIYLSQDTNLSQSIESVLNKSVILRQIVTPSKVIKKIVHKNKVYDGDTLLYEDKINLKCEDLENAKLLFEALGFKELVIVQYDSFVYQKQGLELSFQNVKDLGLLLEIESDKKNLESEEDVMHEKRRLYNLAKSLSLNIGDELNIKKAKALIEKRFTNTRSKNATCFPQTGQEPLNESKNCGLKFFYKSLYVNFIQTLLIDTYFHY